jgi:hypothetical protein
VSLFGKAYLALALILLILSVLWASLLLQENPELARFVVAVPQLDLLEPLARRRYEAQLGVLLSGWGISLVLLVIYALRAPFRIRAAARSQRRLRELEREVLELRTLPLRQREEDDALAAEAHLDLRHKKVMTQQVEAGDSLTEGRL